MNKEYKKTKNFILNYIDKTKLYREFCKNIKSNNKEFLKSIKCFKNGYVEYELVKMYADAIEELINIYDKKLDLENSDEKD